MASPRCGLRYGARGLMHMERANLATCASAPQLVRTAQWARTLRPEMRAPPPRPAIDPPQHRRPPSVQPRVVVAQRPTECIMHERRKAPLPQWRDRRSDNRAPAPLPPRDHVATTTEKVASVRTVKHTARRGAKQSSSTQRGGGATSEQRAWERETRLRTANAEMQRRAAAFHAVLLDSSKQRGYAKVSETKLSSALTRATSLASMASTVLSQAERRAAPPAPWANEVERLHKRRRRPPVLLMATDGALQPEAAIPVSKLDALLIQQATSSRQSLGSARASAATLVPTEPDGTAMCSSDWTHWMFMDDKRRQPRKPQPYMPASMAPPSRWR